MMNRREFTQRLAQGIGAAALARWALPQGLAAESGAEKRAPNIVFLISDQHAFRFNGFAGHPVVRTPNLDRIAAGGVQFRHTYCGSPVCTPARASLMTGMYPSDTNAFCNATAWDGSHPCWGTLLQERGYQCFATGKMDLNPAFSTGFEEVVVDHQHAKGPDITAFFRRPLCMRIDERPQVEGRARAIGSKDHAHIERTLQFIKGQAGAGPKPWIAYCGLNLPHPPYVGPQKHFDSYLTRVEAGDVSIEELEGLHPVYQQLRQFKNIATAIPAARQQRARAAYFATITELDEYAGEVWQALEQTGQLANTIFIYTSDHGESLGDHGLWFKNNLFDVAARVPLIIAGPGIPQGVTADTPVAQVDLVQTILDLAGAARPAALRGHSLVPLMHGQSGDHPGWAYTENHSEGNCTGSFSIRKGPWKYIHFTWGDPLLFNLEQDPAERHNLARDASAKPVLKELEAILRSQVNPEEVTQRAFATQRKRFDALAKDSGEERMVDLFRNRLGEVQAVNLLNAYYGHPVHFTHREGKGETEG